MKNLLKTILLLFLISACQSKIDWKEERKRWGDFTPNQIKTRFIDYKKTPYYEHVINHKGKEALAFMDSLETNSIAYLSDSLLITGLMLKPKQATPSKLPVIVFNRGGNQDMGRLTVGQLIESLSPLALSGYLVIASHYRGNSSSEGKDEFGGDDVHDVLHLIKGLSSLDYADTSKIGLVGISRGGMMSYQVIRESRQIKAVAVIGGMSNLVENLSFHQGMEEVYKDLVPNYQSNEYAPLKARSAYYWAEEMNQAPLLILHGSEDEHVSVLETRKFVSKLKSIDYPFSYHEFKDNHGLVQHHQEMYQLLIAHFNEHLK